MNVSDSQGNGDRGLHPAKQPAKPDPTSLGVPFAAMAEALRANAEALQRLDSNQRRLAESIEKGDRAQHVITSTRALNDTFKGLSEIQRGLLDAVVQERGHGKGLPFAFATIAILAALLGFLLYDRWTSSDTVPRAVFEQLRKTSEDRAQQLADLRGSVRGSAGEVTDLKRRLFDRDAALDTAVREAEALGRKNRQLKNDLDAQQSRLKNFLAVKDIADRVGAVEVRNAQLENENRGLRQRAERAEKERERLLVLMGERKLDARARDPAVIKKALEDKGVLKKAEEEPNPAKLTPSTQRRLRKQLNQLLGQAPGEEAYEVLSFSGVRGGAVLLDVKIGHYRNASLLNSLHCKELEVIVDAKHDTAELRLKTGYIAVTRHPLEKIPFDKAGHSVFLREIGYSAWVERALIPVSLGAGGRLEWKTGPG